MTYSVQLLSPAGFTKAMEGLNVEQMQYVASSMYPGWGVVAKNENGKLAALRKMNARRTKNVGPVQFFAD